MAFDTTALTNTRKGIRDMLPLFITFNGVQYVADRQVLNEQELFTLYGTHVAYELAVRVIRTDLKSEPKEGDKVKVDAPRFGYKNKEMYVRGVQTDPAGITVRLDLEARYES